MIVENKPGLIIKRTINASRARVFAAWTDPRHILKWWGPKDVACVDASVDLRVGGKYRIGNEMPDGSILWITGEYEEILDPEKVVFTWQLEGVGKHWEKVTVEFKEFDAGRRTEIILTHEAIADQNSRNQHEQGWIGCLEGLDIYLTH